MEQNPSGKRRSERIKENRAKTQQDKSKKDKMDVETGPSKKENQTKKKQPM